MTDASERIAPLRTAQEAEQERRALIAQSRMLFRYAAQVIIGRPGTDKAVLDTGSGFLIQLPDSLAFATANHVLEGFEKRADDPAVTLQVGGLSLTIGDRASYRSSYDDLAFVEVSAQEAASIGSTIHSPPAWPPPVPVRNEYVTIVGLPSMTRSQPTRDEVIFGPLIATLPVRNGYTNHFTCQVERQYIDSFTDRPLPPLSETRYGGMSGGPIFLDAGLHFPIVGLVKEVKEDWEYFVLQAFSGVPPKLS